MTGTVSSRVCPSCDALAIRRCRGVFDCPACETVVVDANAIDEER